MKKWAFNFFVIFIRCLPNKIALMLGKGLGCLVYCFDKKHRRQVIANLRQAFLEVKNYREIKTIALKFHINFVQNIIEIIRLPLISKKGYSSVVDLQGQEHIKNALKESKGCIFLSMHSGNWELSNLVGSMQGVPYNMVANRLVKKKSIFEDFLIQCRTSAGCNIIYPGLGGREIIRALKNNEIVTLVADQGGREGELINFFGRNASMSTGAVRLALKYNTPILIVDINRVSLGHHKLTVEPYKIQRTGNDVADLKGNLRNIINLHVKKINNHPHEYMWQYRIWKDSDLKKVVLLNDGRVGHLRQSQAIIKHLESALAERNITLKVEQIDVSYKTYLSGVLFKIRGLFSKWLLSAEKILILKKALTEQCANHLINNCKADFVVSCGSSTAPLNYLLGEFYQARTISILKPGLLDLGCFDTVIMPEHDRPKNFYQYKYLYFTQVAPNMINREYINKNVKELENQFSHLKNNVRQKIGVLIGGNTKGVEFTEHQARIVAHQIVEAAQELNADLIVTMSRRTPKSVIYVFYKIFKESGRCALFIDPNKQNSNSVVGGLLGLADVVVVSGESISMVSEAVSSGKKVVVFPVGDTERFTKPNKYCRFVQILSEDGFLVSTQTSQISQAIINAVRSKTGTRKLTDDYTLLRAMRILI